MARIWRAWAKAEALFSRYGDRVGLTLIGPGGEMRLHAAGVTNADPDNAPSRFNGRGGLGAVMGSKGIQAIVWDAQGAPRAACADQAAFTAAMKQLAAHINSTPQTAETYRKYGTAAVMDVTHALGALPTRNFSLGRFAAKDSINARALHDAILARGGEGRISHACMPGCLIQCSNVFPDQQGKALCSPVEYENLGMLGSNLDIGDLDAIARLNRLCNDLGCDTIELGVALGVAMHAGALPYGDAAAAEAALEEIRHGSPLGRILGSGAGVTGAVFGCRHVPVVKNQGMAAYDPRGVKGVGVTYAAKILGRPLKGRVTGIGFAQGLMTWMARTGKQGADHTAGNTIRANVDHHSPDGQLETSRGSQIMCAVLDSLGCCLFLGAALGDWSVMLELVRARTGVSTTLDELKDAARHTLRLERDFNRRAGLGDAHDRLPDFMREERNPDSGQVFDVREADLRRMAEI